MAQAAGATGSTYSVYGQDQYGFDTFLDLTRAANNSGTTEPQELQLLS